MLIPLLLAHMIDQSIAESVIVFAANKTFTADTKHIDDVGKSALYTYSLGTGKISPLVASRYDLVAPKSLGGGRILYLVSLAHSNRNTFVVYDVLKQKEVRRFVAPPGSIDRIDVYENGKYILLKYWPEEHEGYDPRPEVRIVVLKDFSVWKRFEGVVDGAVNPGAGRIGLVLPKGKLKFVPPIEKGKEPKFDVVGETVHSLAFGDGAWFASLEANDSGPITFQKIAPPDSEPVIVSGGDTSGPKQSPVRTITYDSLYRSSLWYDTRLHQLQMVGKHDQSDGEHFATSVMDFEKREELPLCMGWFIGKDARGRDYSVESEEYVGKYHRGGMRVARIWRYSADGFFSGPLTPLRYDICGACWLER